MELSSIGDQVFAVESITKKRVRKVRKTIRTSFNFDNLFSVPAERCVQRSIACRPHAQRN